MDNKIMQRAMEIVGRYHLNGKRLPKLLIIRDTPEKEQEFIDAQKLKNWNKYVKNLRGGNILPDDVKHYLDAEMPGWRDNRVVADSQHPPMTKAQAILNRYRARGFVLPKEHVREDDRSQDARDASRLRHWRKAAETGKASAEVLAVLTHLDMNMPGWRGGLADTPSLGGSSRRAPHAAVEAEVTFDAIMRERTINSGGVAEQMDRESFCKWFVRFRGEANRRLRAAGVVVESYVSTKHRDEAEERSPSPGPHRLIGSAQLGDMLRRNNSAEERGARSHSASKSSDKRSGVTDRPDGRKKRKHQQEQEQEQDIIATVHL